MGRKTRISTRILAKGIGAVLLATLPAAVAIADSNAPYEAKNPTSPNRHANATAHPSPECKLGDPGSTAAAPRERPGNTTIIADAAQNAPDANNAKAANDTPALRTIDRLTHPHGQYVCYAATSNPSGLLVLIHGMIGNDDSAIEAAETYIKRWTALADREQLVILAPAFDQANFGGHNGPGGGYRGLFGRHVGADEFVNTLVDATRVSFRTLPEKFRLYGHSAGGQFVSRYLVTHPDRVEAAVISASANFAFPAPDVPWTNGMMPLKRRMRWSDNKPYKQIEIKPDPRNWLKAAQIPVTVVVGERDTEILKPIPGNPGENHVARARYWVEAMRNHARENKQVARIRLIVVEKIGHSSKRLTPTCQKALFP